MKPTKNFWPLGIVIAFAAFVAGTAGLIALACSNANDLVSAHYYDDEMRFQNEINQTARARGPGSGVVVTYDAARRRIAVSMPPGDALAGPTGRVQLYRPADARCDRSYELKLDASGTQLVDATGLPPGLWIVKVFWTSSGIDYRDVRRVIIAKEH